MFIPVPLSKSDTVGLSLTGGGERADPGAAAHVLVHGLPRLVPRRRQLLRKGGEYIEAAVLTHSFYVLG